jgi:hypothetical protein
MNVIQRRAPLASHTMELNARYVAMIFSDSMANLGGDLFMFTTLFPSRKTRAGDTK